MHLHIIPVAEFVSLTQRYREMHVEHVCGIDCRLFYVAVSRDINIIFLENSNQETQKEFASAWPNRN